MRIGFTDEQLTVAQRQLRDARRDPRLGRGNEAFVADWWNAVEAAEHTRMVAILGTGALRDTLPEEAPLDQDDPPEGVERVVWERAALAKAQQDNEFTELNAMTLVALLSALDALVENLAPWAHEVRNKYVLSQLMEGVRERVPEAVDEVSDEFMEALEQAADSLVKDKVPKLKPMKGRGAERWEKPLASAGLKSPADRAIPSDLNDALAEIGALRDCIVHRASRIDEKALKDAPTLDYEVGELIRLGRADYRRYSAAIRAYGRAVTDRLLGSVAPQWDLSEWRDQVLLGT